MGKKPAALLLFVSDYKNGSPIEYREIETGNRFKGIQTNGAPVRCLYAHSVQDENPISRAFLIVSKLVKEKQDGAAVNNIRNILAEEAKNAGQEIPGITEIPYDFDKDGNEVEESERLKNIYASIEEATNGEEGRLKYDFYIDYTGGLRDIAFLMTSIIKFFEVNGGSCRKIVYSEYNRDDRTKCRIHSLDKTYDLYQLINGVQEFAASGRADGLKAYFEGKNSGARDVVNRMTEFSDAFSLCDIQKIDSAVTNLKKSMEEFEGTEAEDLDSRMLKTLLPYVREKLQLDKTEEVQYTPLIRWCLSNHLFQQAVTLYVEKIPKELFGNEAVQKFIGETGKKTGADFSKALDRMKDGEYAEALYEEMFTALKSEKALSGEGQKIRKFQTACEEIKSAAGKNNMQAARLIKEELEKEKDPDLQNGFKRLLRLNRENVFPNLIYGRKCNYNSISSILGGTGQDHVAHFLMYNDEKVFGNTPKVLDQKREQVYANKVAALKNLKGRIQVDLRLEALYRVFCCYFAIKLIRNRMNHAAENAVKQEEERAIKYLESEHFFAEGKEDTATSKLEAIRGMIENGLKVNADFKEKMQGCRKN